MPHYLGVHHRSTERLDVLHKKAPHPKMRSKSSERYPDSFLTPHVGVRSEKCEVFPTHFYHQAHTITLRRRLEADALVVALVAVTFEAAVTFGAAVTLDAGAAMALDTFGAVTLGATVMLDVTGAATTTHPMFFSAQSQKVLSFCSYSVGY